jgi:hypothetical protein
VDILVRQEYTEGQVKRAAVKASEFRRNRYTSGSAHLDDMIALRKAIILCDQHALKFKPRAAHYELHPSPSMRRVQGNCDVCKVFQPGALFLHESQALDERRKSELYRQAAEYSSIVAR